MWTAVRQHAYISEIIAQGLWVWREGGGVSMSESDKKAQQALDD